MKLADIGGGFKEQLSDCLVPASETLLPNDTSTNWAEENWYKTTTSNPTAGTICIITVDRLICLMPDTHLESSIYDQIEWDGVGVVFMTKLSGTEWE